MRALWGRVAGLIVLAPMVVVPVVLTAPPTQAATGTARPTSIALDAAGTSYVGYATGRALSRVSRAGTVLAPTPLDRPAPVNGLAVDSADRVWVAYDDSLSVLEADGTVVRHLARSPGAACAHDPDHHVSRYGGLALSPTQVFVADRCAAAIEVYDRTSGSLTSRVTLSSRAHAMAWQRAGDGKPARLFVAVPDRGTVQTFNAETLRATSRPSYELRVTAPPRGRRPVPSGLAVDRRGYLTVTDLANHAIYVVDARAGYRLVRTLGHPAAPGSADGYLNLPVAVAQHPQDGSGLSGNLFIADQRNGRVQRWDVGGGYTFWARPLAPPAVVTDPDDPDDPDEPDDPTAPGSPGNSVAPVISSTAGGTSLLCSTGTWSAGTASFGYQWLRDGVRVPGVSGSTYPLGAGDEGTEIVCRVTATTTTGSASASSDPWFVGTAVGPVNTSAPSVVGTAARGQTLTCATGAWSGTPAPRFSYVWLRGAIQVGDTPSRVVTAADVGTSLSCTVIATNQAGSTAASSPAVVPTGAGPDPTDPTPPADPCVGAGRVTIAGGAGHVRVPRVSLTIVVPADATSIEVSDTADFTAATTVTRSAGCAVPWTLPVPASDTTPVAVHVRWAGGTTAGQVVTDTVRFDRSAPSIGAATVRFSAKRWLLRVTASDVSGIATVTYASARTGGLRTVRAAAAIRVPAPEAARWVRATDRLGNVSAWRRTT